ncbi:hypothetical protein QS95_22800 [Pseudomonas fluorescens]|uniref:Uncharacterized protein n=1 Tax=Pseudomonas fluorescens TaxID=294 RepID=A0AAE2A4S6_PSEFL|nr:hypothetical protein QS95_22800 [Pseudomonas fluorescens]
MAQEFYKNEFRIPRVKVLHHSAMLISKIYQQLPHRQVGRIGRREDLACNSVMLQTTHDLPTHAGTPARTGDDHEGYEPLTEKASIQTAVAEKNARIVSLTDNPALMRPNRPRDTRSTAAIFFSDRINLQQAFDVAWTGAPELATHEYPPCKCAEV